MATLREKRQPPIGLDPPGLVAAVPMGMGCYMKI